MLFFLNIYQDENKVISTVNRIKTLYPNSEIVLRYDGTKPCHFSGMANIYFGKRLKKDFGGLITHESLTIISDDFNYYDFCIEIDPDTLVNKKIQRLALPNHLGANYQNTHIYGGAIFWHLNVIKKILDSNLLLDNIH